MKMRLKCTAKYKKMDEGKMTKSIEIKKLTKEDASVELAKTLWQVATSGFGENSPWTEKQLFKLLEAGNSTMLAAMQEEKIVGLLVASTTTVESDIYMIVVGEDFKRQGIGRKLLEYLIEDCTEQGLETIFLEVRETNTPAYNLYEAVGFEEIGRRRAYYSSPIEDALMMKLDLPREEQ